MMPVPAASSAPNTPTTTEALNQTYVWGISLAAAMGALLFGYDWVVIGGAKPFYEPYFQIHSPARQGWAMSCALVGCLLGSIASGVLSDRFGRKRMLIIAGFTFAISSVGTGMAHSFPEFVMWRIAGGLGIGLASILSPMYIAEVAPAELRGKLVASNQLAIVIGIVLAQVMNWLIGRPLGPNATSMEIRQSWDGQLGWRWMFAVTAIPASLFIVAMFFAPESPRWLARKGLRARSERILSNIGGEAYSARVFAEIEETLTHGAPEPGLRELLNRRYVRPLLLGIGLAVLQQWCGINVIFNYAQEVFTAAGYNLSSMLFNIMVTGFVTLIFTVAAIATVDGLGRRALMLAGCGGLAVLYVGVGSAYYFHVHGFVILLLVAGAIACYSMTLAPVTWVLLSEIFPNKIRSAGMSVATTFLWSACFVLTYTFPILNQSLGSARIFWLYALICLLGFGMIFKWVPETKGCTLEAIEGFWK
jgi:SP family arabinose:H+ symporter-like MFS transporter